MLTDEEKARIRAEEEYRERIRLESQRHAQQINAPNYWTGFILNLLIVGIGHFVIGEVGWGVVWLLLAIFLVPATGFIAWPFIAFGVLIHYRNVYAHKYQ
ncbi:hypothetical protein [Deinococcus cellulosilyticus]|uniref:Uncharacterized protein n=1 Tax=Deinococcus cellulosilyticus (strain DSM 18568 / NBRC 106333 / KACC 11606 / 5516J-15) TaxID=1223518 RepID=A0A511NA79_DEIC1|nr:hypothetical protein [Deinococcus cellulosilyticus]GEM49734.1 hypothetical protein DC3_53690 [Deinococcus cellulosilyticus NBRC 106333 = KACC 11606]